MSSLASNLWRKIRAVFHPDYGRDGPSFFDPRQPKASFVRSVFASIGVGLSIDVALRLLSPEHGGIGSAIGPWKLFSLSLVGAAFWFSDKVQFEFWLLNAKRKNVTDRSSRNINGSTT
jgi:hypothetical protein